MFQHSIHGYCTGTGPNHARTSNSKENLVQLQIMFIKKYDQSKCKSGTDQSKVEPTSQYKHSFSENLGRALSRKEQTDFGCKPALTPARSGRMLHCGGSVAVTRPCGVTGTAHVRSENRIFSRICNKIDCVRSGRHPAPDVEGENRNDVPAQVLAHSRGGSRGWPVWPRCRLRTSPCRV